MDTTWRVGISWWLHKYIEVCAMSSHFMKSKSLLNLNCQHSFFFCLLAVSTHFFFLFLLPLDWRHTFSSFLINIYSQRTARTPSVKEGINGTIQRKWLAFKSVKLYGWLFTKDCMKKINAWRAPWKELSRWVLSERRSVQKDEVAIYKVNGYTDEVCKFAVHKLQWKVSTRVAIEG
jgi:hypothetical protein